jgi:hypothetical protein
VDGVAPGAPRNGQLAILCEQLPALRRLCLGPVGVPVLAVLEEAVAAAVVGEPVDEYLKLLGIAGSAEPGKQERGEPGPERGSLPPRLGQAAPAYLPGRYVCPRNACIRREYREVGAALPTCAVFDQALHFVEER